MEDEKLFRILTETNLTVALDRIHENYMKIYDEYNDTMSRDSAFLKDAVDSMLGVDALTYVYTRDKKLHPSYAIEKLNLSINKLEGAKRYYEAVLREMNEGRDKNE